MKLKKGDTVLVRTGKDAGKTGTIVHAYPKRKLVLVEKVNVHTKFTRRGEGRPGTQTKVESPLSVSKLTLICPNCKAKTRVGYHRPEKGAKYRICKKCNESVEKATSKSDKQKTTTPTKS